MIVKVEYYVNDAYTPNYHWDLDERIRIVNINKLGILYMLEEEIVKIENNIMCPSRDDRAGYYSERLDEYEDYFIRIILKNEFAILAKNITYPTDSQDSIETVVPNLHTHDYSELTSVLNKIDKTLNKLYDKKNWVDK